MALFESYERRIKQINEFLNANGIASSYEACAIIRRQELDSTNVIDVPEVAVITNIGLDHTDFLGNTLSEIATTKAGIFKEGGHAVVYRGTPGVEAS